MNTQLITPAATVLVIRDGKADIEVFMVERSNRQPFGNLFVFTVSTIYFFSSFQNYIVAPHDPLGTLAPTRGVL